MDIARRIGVPGLHAWLDAMKHQELRGYARVTLGMMAADLPESSLPLVLEPDPDDMAWLATDLLALACGTDDPDPEEVAGQFAEAVPAGEEAWIIGLMAQSAHLMSRACWRYRGTLIRTVGSHGTHVRQRARWPARVVEPAGASRICLP